MKLYKIIIQHLRLQLGATREATDVKLPSGSGNGLWRQRVQRTAVTAVPET